MMKAFEVRFCKLLLERYYCILSTWGKVLQTTCRKILLLISNLRRPRARRSRARQRLPGRPRSPLMSPISRWPERQRGTERRRETERQNERKTETERRGDMKRLTPSQDLVITKDGQSEQNISSGGSAQGWRGASESDQQRALPHRHLHPRRPRSRGGEKNFFWIWMRFLTGTLPVRPWSWGCGCCRVGWWWSH